MGTQKSNQDIEISTKFTRKAGKKNAPKPADINAAINNSKKKEGK